MARYPHAVVIRPLMIAGIWLLAGGAAALTVFAHAGWGVAAAGLLGLALLGSWDLFQRRHTILRLYPIIGHVRFLMEMIRPEVRQYFIESNIEATPFDRETRDLVYERQGHQG